MITVFKPADIEFDFNEVKQLYDKNQKLLEDDNFNDVVNRTDFYSYYDDNEFLGCIYFYYIGKDLYFNAFAKRGHHLKNLECLKMTLDWYDTPIYANALHKTSILCLLRLGFKKVKDNIYKYERSM